jgi:hypothetical protein
MHRSGNDFSYIHNVTRDKHAYKFIVDDVWRHAPDQPTVADGDGRINNYIDVHEFAPYGELFLFLLPTCIISLVWMQLVTKTISIKAKVWNCWIQ